VTIDPVREGPEPSLGRQVRKGLTWSLLNTVVGRIGTVLVGIVLARILTPEDYGVFAVALVALNALLSMNELGVSLALVRWPEDRAGRALDRIGPTVATLAVGGSAGLYALCFAAAPSIAEVMGAPQATGVLRLLTASVLIDGVTAVPSALLTREFRQDKRMLAEFISFGVSTAVSVGLAMAGFGAWSLAWGRMAGNGASAVAFLALAPVRYRPGWNGAEARRLLAFGLPLAASSLLVFAMQNVGYVVVGSMLGPIALGFYLMAFNLSSWPVNVISVAARRVSLAGFSRLADQPARFAGAFGTALSLLMAPTVPICVLLGVLAHPLVEFVYGPKWLPAAGALRWLAVLGAARVAAELAYDALVAAGRPRATLWLQGLWTLALLPALALGALVDGITGVGAGHAVVAALVVLPAFALAVRRSGVGLRRMGAALARPLAAGAAVAAAGLLSQRLLAGLGFGDTPFLELAVAGTLGVAACALVLAPMRHLLRDRSGARAAAELSSARGT
jgi:O-antigen/teichoic acid export membrane protein